VLALSGFYIVWRGAAPERIGIGILVVGSILTVVAGETQGLAFTSFEAAVFAVDLAVLAAYVALALCADRYWPLWVAGLQAIGVATHAAELASSAVIPWAYSIGQALWGYPMLLAIVIGAARHRSRTLRYGADRSWNSFFAPPGRRTPPNGPIG
jgi:hypothetical protein